MTFIPKKLVLDNFKSVDRSWIEFGPITVIVGANSSGKSSLIQSLLLLVQASRSSRNDARFPLNGDFVRLGRFNELRNARFPDRDSISISLQGQLQSENFSENGYWQYEFVGAERPSEIQLRGLRFALGENESQIAIEFVDREEFDDDLNSSSRYPASRYPSYVMPVKGDVRSKMGIESVHAVTMNGLSINEILGQSTLGRLLAGRLLRILYNDALYQALRNPDRLRDRPNFRATQDFDFSLSVIGREGLISSICHLLQESPGQNARAIARQLEVARSDVNKILYANNNLFEREISGTIPRWRLVDGIVIPEISSLQNAPEISRSDLQEFSDICRAAISDLADHILDHVGDRAFREVFDSGENSDILGDVDTWAASLLSVIDDRFSPTSPEIESIAEILRNQSEYDEWFSNDFVDEVEPQSGLAMTNMLYPINLGLAFDLSPGDAFFNFLSREIRYLGPIREEPHRLDSYRQVEGTVGVRGEFTAAALHESSDLEVEYWIESNVLATESLSKAVSYWLQKLGLAEDFVTNDVGGHGIELRVRPSSDAEPQLLTALGVGVSQALPVIVLGLLSRPGDCIVMEQPELHLHPLMQSRLGEFFWSLAQSGRSVVIETHSEHILNAFRALIAESSSDVSKTVQPVFAEQTNGISGYRLPSVDEFGLLSEDWPSGFLNVITDEARRIIDAAIIKRDRNNI